MLGHKESVRFLSFNIVHLHPPSLLCLLSPPSTSLHQEWCPSLRLCAPATSTPTLCCTWTWARTPGSFQERTLRLEGSRPETQTLAALFVRWFSGFVWRLSFFPSAPRTCISSCLSPTAWYIWICRAQIAPWTRWVMNGREPSNVYAQWLKLLAQFDCLFPPSHAAIWGSFEGVLCWSFLSESFQKFILSQVSPVLKDL